MSIRSATRSRLRFSKDLAPARPSTRCTSAAKSSRHRAERGLAQILILVGMLPLIVTATTLLSLITKLVTETDQRIHRLEAQAVSASGAQDALARLEDDATFRGQYEVSLDGGVARVSVTDWSSDKLDNNGDGVADDALESGLIGIQSAGWVNAVLDADGQPIERGVRYFSSLTQAVARTTDSDMSFNQGLYIDDTLAGIKIAGDSFLISGKDKNLDGSDGPEADVSGIGVPGDPKDIITQLDSTQWNNIVGTGGLPSVHESTPLDLEQVMVDLGQLATRRWTTDASFTGKLGSKSPWVTEIAVAEGDLTFTGGVSGAGILIVHGDLVINGSVDYAGIVIVGGALRFNGGGSKVIQGAVACLGSVDGDDLRINGSVTIQYSSEAVNMASSSLGKTALITWMQR